MENPRQRLERFRKGVDILGTEIPETTKSMFDFIQTAQKKENSALEKKN